MKYIFNKNRRELKSNYYFGCFFYDIESISAILITANGELSMFRLNQISIEWDEIIAIFHISERNLRTSHEPTIAVAVAWNSHQLFERSSSRWWRNVKERVMNNADSIRGWKVVNWIMNFFLILSSTLPSSHTQHYAEKFSSKRFIKIYESK